MHAKLQSVWLCATLWTAASQTSLFMGFSRQEYWSELPCSLLGDLPHPGIEPMSRMSPALAGSFFTTSAPWEARFLKWYVSIIHLLNESSWLQVVRTIWSQLKLKVACDRKPYWWWENFPGGPVAKTPWSQWRGAWVLSLVRELRSHMPQLKILHATVKIKDHPPCCNYDLVKLNKYFFKKERKPCGVTQNRFQPALKTNWNQTVLLSASQSAFYSFLPAYVPASSYVQTLMEDLERCQRKQNGTLK